MEDISKNKVLSLNSEALLEVKRNKILETLESGVDVFFFYDTETTGLSPYPRGDKGRDRILEMAFTAFYLDGNDEFKQLTAKDESGFDVPVTFQEYVNPYKESNEELTKTRSVRECDPYAFEVHKISEAFLNGKETLNGIRLEKPAPTFKEVKPHMERFLCLDEQANFKANAHFVSHNGISFDDKMLTEEMKYIDAYDPEIRVVREFESLLSSSIDTKRVMQKMFKKRDLEKFGEIDGKSPGYSLDYLAKMLKVSLDARSEVHGAMLDSIILKDAYNALIKTKRYKAIKNNVEFNTTETASKKETELKPLSKYFESKTNVSGDILNIIKTDASFNEGTGMVPEYVARAKEAGLTNLMIADVVSMSRFIEFHQACEKENIKPILGTTFKLESQFDIYNIFSPEKTQGTYVKNLTMKFINMALERSEDNQLKFEELVELGANDIEKWGVVINSIKRIEQTLSEGKAPNKKTLTAINNLLSDIDPKENLKVEVKKLKIAPYVDIIKSSASISSFEGFNRVIGHSDLVIYAKDEEGYANIKKLITVAHRDGQHYLSKETDERSKGEQPLITLEQLKDYNSGLGYVLGGNRDILDKALNSGYETMADGVLKYIDSTIGLKDVSLQMSIRSERDSEVGLAKEKETNDKLVALSKEYGLPIIASQTASFAEKEDFIAHKNKYAILLDKLVSDYSFEANRTKEEYLKSNEEMNTIFKNNDVLKTNAATLIENSNISPVFNVPTLPNFKTEGGRTQAEELTARAYKGLDSKIQASFERSVRDGKANPAEFDSFKEKYKERLDYELGVIIDMDFPGYFLIKQQMIEYCKKEGIPVGAGRGSAAGSLVVYSLGITDVDPIEYDLIFERFLNPERKEMPDIDTDIDGDYREAVLDFLREEYKENGEGYEGAAFIMTKSTFSAKNTIKSLGKSMGLTPRWYEMLAKLVSEEPGTTLAKELEFNEDLRYRYDHEVKTRRVLDLAMQLERNGGRQMAIGKHAGGLVVGNLVSQGPITYVGGIPVMQYDKKYIEVAGAVKFDLLGSSNLTKLDKALRNIIEVKGMKEMDSNNIEIHGKSFNFDNFLYSDPSTYEMLQQGKSSNVFQVESMMFQGLLKLIKPNNIEEITSIISLGRPGPLQSKMHEMFAESKFDPSKRHRYHESIDHLLDETHGTIVYQEQIMAIAREMAGYTMGGADKLRKAMGKKNLEIMQQETQKFVDGAVEKEIDGQLAEEIFSTVEKFSGYGFNKSHAMAYAFLTYKTAFLRRHYPTEYMAAVLTVDANESSNKKVVKDIESLSELGLSLFSPQINNSERRFKPGDTTGILYGFNGITGFSDKDIKNIIEEREKAPFKTLFDFTSRTVSYTVAEKLIDTGSLDALSLSTLPNEIKAFTKELSGIERKIFKRVLLKEHLNVLQPLMKSDASKKKMIEAGEETYFKELDNASIVAMKNFKENEDTLTLAGLEKEMKLLSGYITAHPLDVGGQREKIIAHTNEPQVMISNIDTIKEENRNAIVNVAGMVKTILANRRSPNSDGTYSLIEISDGSATTTLFMGGEEYNNLNGKIKAKNGIGLVEGEVIGANIGFYEKNGEIKTKTYEVYLPKFEIESKISDRKKKKHNNNNNYRR